MDRFANLATFTQVVSTGSFSAAARKLDVSPAAVGKQIAMLEAWLGARLFDRTTRRLRLTDAGQEFHQRCTRILDEINDARREASATQAEPRGQLRVSAPASFAAMYLGGAVAKFAAAHPQVSVDLQLYDGKVDLIEGGFDCAIRIGKVTEANVIARRIGTNNFMLCAAPSYLQRRGEPQTPQQLRDHDCLHYTLGPAQWTFTSPAGKEETVNIAGRLKANNGLALAAAAIEGHGVTYAPAFLVADAVRAKQLTRLLPKYQMASAPIRIVYPAGRHAPAKVRRFAEFLAAQWQTVESICESKRAL